MDITDIAKLLLVFRLGVYFLNRLEKESTYVIPERAKPYLNLFASAEEKYGLPPNLLVRVADQESDFNPAAHNVGSNAQGMMQIVPRWHPDVDPYDVYQAIPYAARYLRSLYDKFGSWKLALAAYNWGQGNVGKYGIDGPQLPLETKKYFTQILKDIPHANA